MESEWPEVELQNIVTKLGDGLHGTPEYSENGQYYFINGSNLNSGNIVLKNDTKRVSVSEYEKHKKVLNKNTLLVSINGTIGNVAYYNNEPIVLGKSACYFNLDEGVSRRFIRYILSGSAFLHYLESHSTGTTIKNVSLKMMREFHFKLPPLPEQKAIAHILGSLDDKIELNRKMNATLEGMAQALFKSWFVDFDPVIDNALVAGNPIPDEFADRAETRRKALADNTANREAAKNFPASFHETEAMGWVPEGWKVSTIGEEVDSVGGGTPSTKCAEFWNDGDIHWTTPKDLSGQSSNVLLKTDRKITEAGLRKISSGLLPVDTVLMSSRAPVGYLALAKVPVAINQGYIAMKCSRQLTPEYVIQWAHSVMDDIQQRASGTTFAEISKKSFRVIPVIVPDNDVLKSYSKTVNSFYNKITKNLQESCQLEALRDTLLPKLISGELEMLWCRVK